MSGGRITFHQDSPPENPANEDFWVNTGDGHKRYYCVKTMKMNMATLVPAGGFDIAWKLLV